MSNNIDIGITIPPLPEGWSGTPDELFDWLGENAIFSFDGDFPTGQIGGSRPTQDVGIWYSEDGIEKFESGKYQPMSDVPVGALLPWASVSSAIPANYLYCDGRSLARSEYAELFAVIGITYGSESVTTFTIPDMRGRVAVGSGIGDYKPQGITGRMKELVAGQYGGGEWPTRTPLPANSPTKSMKVIATTAAKKDYLNIREPYIVMPWLIRYR